MTQHMNLPKDGGKMTWFICNTACKIVVRNNLKNNMPFIAIFSSPCNRVLATVVGGFRRNSSHGKIGNLSLKSAYLILTGPEVINALKVPSFAPENLLNKEFPSPSLY